MDVAPLQPIPTPRVPSPPISAPQEARNPDGFIPAPSGQMMKDVWPEEVLDPATRLPDLIREPIFKAAGLVNKVIFKSRPAGPPVPVEQGSWQFSVIGDYGSGSKALHDVTTQMARTNPELVLTTGDNVYWHGSEKEYAKKWDPPQYFGDIRRNFPVIPSLGNHDMNTDVSPYFRRFPELGGARYYSFDKGNVHFVALDSNESLIPSSPQAQWFDQDLAATKAEFKVVYFHHPMTSSYQNEGTELYGYLGPTLAKRAVDLVLTGHVHNYERSRPFNEHGTVEVIVGNGGHTLFPFVQKQPERSAYRDTSYGFLNVEVRGKELVGRYVDRDGKVRDTFVIDHNQHVPGTAAAAQATAGAAAVPATG
jgi:hypothetical protein